MHLLLSQSSSVWFSVRACMCVCECGGGNYLYCMCCLTAVRETFYNKPHVNSNCNYKWWKLHPWPWPCVMCLTVHCCLSVCQTFRLVSHRGVFWDFPANGNERQHRCCQILKLFSVHFIFSCSSYFTSCLPSRTFSSPGVKCDAHQIERWRSGERAGNTMQLIQALTWHPSVQVHGSKQQSNCNATLLSGLPGSREVVENRWIFDTVRAFSRAVFGCKGLISCQWTRLMLQPPFGTDRQRFNHKNLTIVNFHQWQRKIHTIWRGFGHFWHYFWNVDLWVLAVHLSFSLFLHLCICIFWFICQTAWSSQGQAELQPNSLFSVITSQIQM